MLSIKSFPYFHMRNCNLNILRRESVINIVYKFNAHAVMSEGARVYILL